MSKYEQKKGLKRRRGTIIIMLQKKKTQITSKQHMQAWPKEDQSRQTLERRPHSTPDDHQRGQSAKRKGAC
jgi:hypothetical protein